MCGLRPLKIGTLTARLPVIQGGMGVGISLSSLAGAVAREGGIGLISTAQIGFREPDFAEDSQAANLRAIEKELKKARKGDTVKINYVFKLLRKSFKLPGPLFVPYIIAHFSSHCFRIHSMHPYPLFPFALHRSFCPIYS